MNLYNLIFMFSYDMLGPPMTVMFLNHAFYTKSTPMFSLERTGCSCHFISYHCDIFFS